MNKKTQDWTKMNQPLLNILEEAVYTAGDINSSSTKKRLGFISSY